MKAAIANLQRNIFVILLYASSVSGMACDLANITNRSAVFAAWDTIMLFLILFSLYYVPKGYALIVALLLTATILNFVYSPVSLLVSLNGVREILVFILLPIFYYKVFANGNEEETSRYIRIFKNFSWFFLLIQVPATVFQYIQFGASDAVGGTYGSLNSGSLSIIILCLIYFLFQFPMPVWKKITLFFLLAPLMLNETKISFILIPMLGVFIFFKPNFKNIFWAGIAGGLFLLLASQLYVHEQANVGHSIFDIFNKDFLDEYLLSYDELHPDVPRFTRMILGYQIISQDNITLLFGMEYGMFRGSTTGAVSQFAQNYGWLLTGTRPYAFFVMLQGGLVMVAGIFLVILKICNFFKDLNKQTLFYFIIFLVMELYSDSFRWQNFLIIFMFVLFFVNSDYFKSKAYLHENTDSYN
ncbi:MAG: hypothetical protein H0X41_02570 [Chitinophagaceae bacterium]|nr:hypothetical protein [Chitinophagaceae bacterium]